MSTLPLASQTSDLPGMTTGDSGSGTASSSLMTLTGEVSNLTLLSDITGVVGMADEQLPEAMSECRAVAVLCDAQKLLNMSLTVRI